MSWGYGGDHLTHEQREAMARVPGLGFLAQIVASSFLAGFVGLGLVILFCPWYLIFLTAAFVIGGFGISLFRTEVRAGADLDVESVRGNANLATAVFFVVFAVYCLHLAYDDWTTRRSLTDAPRSGPRLGHVRER